MDINNTIILPNIDSPEYTDIFLNVATQCRRVTRSESGVISCKSSQLVYIIIALIWTNTTLSYHEKAEKVLKVYEMCNSNPNINKFLLNNPDSFPYEVIEQNNIPIFFSPRNHKKILTMGLVNIQNNNKGEYPAGVIDHYFIIVNRNRDYFIISSYGSDYVKVPQIEIPLDLIDLDNVINAFNDAERGDRISIITHFLQKYFLSNGETNYFRDEDSFSKPKMLKYVPEEGAKLEIENYLIPNKFKFYYFPTFINSINDIAESIILGGNKHKKTRRNKKTRKNKKTRNKSKNKFKNKKTRRNKS
jgi:hypothetical protein